MKLRDLIFGKKQEIVKEKKQIKYLTLNGFEVRMTPEGFAQFEKDNKETLEYWKDLKAENGKPYYRTKEFNEFVVVYVGKDFDDISLRKYVEKNYNKIVKEK